MLTTFREVGEEVGLLPATLSRYVAYMLIRWAHRERELCSEHYISYARQWALRFKEGSEYQESDCDGISVLRSIDGVVFEDDVAMVITPDGPETVGYASHRNPSDDWPVFYQGKTMTYGEYICKFRGGGFPWQH